jgi:hypothetical protein
MLLAKLYMVALTLISLKTCDRRVIDDGMDGTDMWDRGSGMFTATNFLSSNSKSLLYGRGDSSHCHVGLMIIGSTWQRHSVSVFLQRIYFRLDGYDCFGAASRSIIRMKMLILANNNRIE